MIVGYSINCAAALKNKFMHARADMADSPIGHIADAFRFDASLYTRYLRGLAEQHGVRRTEAAKAPMARRVASAMPAVDVSTCWSIVQAVG